MSNCSHISALFCCVSLLKLDRRFSSHFLFCCFDNGRLEKGGKKEKKAEEGSDEAGVCAPHTSHTHTHSTPEPSPRTSLSFLQTHIIFSVNKGHFICTLVLRLALLVRRPAGCTRQRPLPVLFPGPRATSLPSLYFIYFSLNLN